MITLEWGRDLKENMQEATRITLDQVKETLSPMQVRNRHEGYGIAAEGYSGIQAKMKRIKAEMDDFLRLLPDEESDILNIVGSLYNSALEVAVESIKMSTQCQRILDDLYHEERKVTPIEEYLEELNKSDGENDGFEEVTEER